MQNTIGFDLDDFSPRTLTFSFADPESDTDSSDVDIVATPPPAENLDAKVSLLTFAPTVAPPLTSAHIALTPSTLGHISPTLLTLANIVPTPPISTYIAAAPRLGPSVRRGVGRAAPPPSTANPRADLKKHLQAAVSLELQTIPLYLYAAYSIKKPGPARWSIMNVVKQEMLHLALAGNILCSIGGAPILYHPKTGNHSFVPEYPDEMPYQDITLNLDSANKRTLRTFMELERPEPALNLVDEASVSQFKIYASIGAFYKAVALELSHWNAASEGLLFLPETINTQFSYEDGSWYDKNMIIIKDNNSAQAAITTIAEQGEGSTKSLPRPKLPNDGRVLEPPPPVALRSHFEVFEDLYNGPKLDCHNFIKNPKTSNLTTHRAYLVLVACDAAYCYLLISIEKVWDAGIDAAKRSKLVTNNLRNIMSKVLLPLATFLSRESYDVSGNSFRLAPFFNFHQFANGTTCHSQLMTAMQNAVNRFPRPELTDIKTVVDHLEPVNFRGWRQQVVPE